MTLHCFPFRPRATFIFLHFSLLTFLFTRPPDTRVAPHSYHRVKHSRSRDLYLIH